MGDPADDASADEDGRAAPPSDDADDATSSPEKEDTGHAGEANGAEGDGAEPPADGADDDRGGADGEDAEESVAAGETNGDEDGDVPDDTADGDATDEDGDEPDDTADGDATDEDGDAPDDTADGDATDEDGDEPDDTADGDVTDEADEEGGDDEVGDIDAGITDGAADTEARSVRRHEEESDGLTDVELSHAPDDEEQPLEAHITEMVHRFLAVAIAMGGVALIALLWSDDMINFLWYSFLGPGPPLCPGTECPQTFRPHLYHPLSLVLARLKVAVLVGFVVGLPVAVYQTYLFMRPGLYPRERRYYLAAVPTSLVLAGVGVAFAYFLVLPALFSYFLGYSTRAAEAALGLAETFNIIVIMLGFFALVFQIPLLVMLAIMMGVTTRRWLENRRLYFWMGFGGVAFIFSPDPTGMAPLLVALTMIGLFEGTLLLLRWTGKDSPILAPEPLRARRPYAWGLALLVGYLLGDLPLPTGYYDQFPPVVTDLLVDAGLTAATPLLVGVGLVAIFEIGFYLMRRFGAGLRTQLWMYRIRRPVWVGAVVVGYLASPNPAILETLRGIALEPVVVGAVVVGLFVLYEVLILLVVWRRG